MRESEILHAIRAALAADPRVTIWRCNGGVDVARGIRYGLGIGAADLIGIVRPQGRFFACEVKTDTGKQTPEQRAWQRSVERFGGFYAIVRSVDDALSALDRAVRGAVS